MNINITKKTDGTYTLEAFAPMATPGNPPLFTARERSVEQLAALLPIILAQGPSTPRRRARPGAPERPVQVPGRQGAQRLALAAVLDALDGWIEGAQSNHDDMGHRGENTGDECWRSFAPGDIRNMINDAARELGVTEFPYPTIPKEDQK